MISFIIIFVIGIVIIIQNTLRMNKNGTNVKIIVRINIIFIIILVIVWFLSYYLSLILYLKIKILTIISKKY